MKRLLIALFALIALSACTHTPYVFGVDPAKTPCKTCKPIEPVACVEVEVDYDLSLCEIVRGYDRVNDYFFDDSFKLRSHSTGGKKKEELCWFTFGYRVSKVRRVKRLIEFDRKFLAANIWQLHAFVQALTDDKPFPIVGPGNTWDIYFKPDNVYGPYPGAYYENAPIILRDERDGLLLLNLGSQVGHAYYPRPAYRFLAVRVRK